MDLARVVGGTSMAAAGEIPHRKRIRVDFVERAADLALQAMDGTAAAGVERAGRYRDGVAQLCAGGDVGISRRRTELRRAGSLAISPVTLATAKLSPERFRSGGTPGMGRGNPDPGKSVRPPGSVDVRYSSRGQSQAV